MVAAASNTFLAKNQGKDIRGFKKITRIECILIKRFHLIEDDLSKNLVLIVYIEDLI